MVCVLSVCFACGFVCVIVFVRFVCVAFVCVCVFVWFGCVCGVLEWFAFIVVFCYGLLVMIWLMVSGFWFMVWFWLWCQFCFLVMVYD